MKRDDYYQERWLKPFRLPSEGLNVTISRLFNEAVGRKQEDKPVMSFDELDEDLILNKSQWNALWDLLGSDDATEWVGRRVKVVPVKIKTENDTKEVETIAIEPADPLKKPLEKLVKRTPTPAPVPAGRRVDREAIPF